jgi:hypothetical protein
MEFVTDIWGRCKCGMVKYKVKRVPNEIANCHCITCQNLHQRPFVSFAKYNLNEVIIINKENLALYQSSDRASRIYCKHCKIILLMIYKNSSNAWINIETIDLDTNKIKHYDIYTDSAIVDLPCDKMRVIGFNNIVAKLLNDDIENVFIEPQFQHLANLKNIIMTFQGKDGNKYLTLVKYDNVMQQIFPPD